MGRRRWSRCPRPRRVARIGVAWTAVLFWTPGLSAQKLAGDPTREPPLESARAAAGGSILQAVDGSRRSVELFGGLSYLDFDAGGLEDLDTDIDGFGVQAEVTFFVTERIGISMEFGRHTGDLDLPRIAIVPIPVLEFSQRTWMVGPRVRFGGDGRVTPSLRLLAGVADGGVGIDLLRPLGLGRFTVDDDVFAGALGGAIDVAISDAVAWRVVQPDLLLTAYAADVQLSLRVATGLVLRF